MAGQEWRSNTLFRSADRNLANGISIPDPAFGDPYAGSPITGDRPNFSRQIIGSLGLAATDLSQYEYYSPFGWVRNCPFYAVQVIWDATARCRCSGMPT